MTDSSLHDTHATPDETRTNDPRQADDDLSELRRLLLHPEQVQLSALQAHVDHLEPMRVEDVSQMLPEAIQRRPKPDEQLTTALLPTVEEAIKVSVTQDPKTLADAIFPVMGPAIRRAIAHAFNSMIQALNQALAYSVSLRGLKWRFEALRTGKPFAEVVLLHSLIYRVEQIFLIHRDTGLLLQHVTIGSVTTHDPDVISGMLTAIQDFVRDSFGLRPDENLERFQVGDLMVWVEQGPFALIAAVIRGHPPHDLRTMFQDTLATIHLEQSHALGDFEGDAAPFAASRQHLESCLVMQAETTTTKTSPVLWIALILCLAGLGLWIGVALRENWRWAQYVRKLHAVPGIVVTQAEKRRGHYVVSGLRDPLTADPILLLQDSQVPRDRVMSHWEPYQALYPPFILARARQALQPPETVTLRLEDGILYATGAAPHMWIMQARELARLVPGVTHWQEDHLIDMEVREVEAIRAVLEPPETVTLRVDNGTLVATGVAPHAWIVQARQRVAELPRITHFHTDHLVDLEQQQLARHAAQIENQVLHFDRDEIRLLPGQEERVQQLVHDLQAFLQAAQALGKQVHVSLIGHTDETGPERLNLALSQQRADHVRTLLVARGVPTTSLSAVGVGARAPLRAEITEQDRAFNRSVSFRVILVDELNTEGTSP